MQRAALIEQILRQVYGGYVPDDASITPMLVNQYIDQGIAFAAKTNYTDNLKLEGISFVNNSFYITFKNLAISKDERNLWKVTLPQIPVGVGYSEGISTVQLKEKIVNKTNCFTYSVYNFSDTLTRFFNYTDCSGAAQSATVLPLATISVCAKSYEENTSLSITKGANCTPALSQEGNMNPLTLPCIPITQNQKTYFQSMPHIPQQTLYYNEGEDVFIVSSLKLNDYIASVTMVSGGDSTDLTSTLNIPPDYIPAVIQYVQQQLMIMKGRPQDLANDGTDIQTN
jgi:hypothetical protein